MTRKPLLFPLLCIAPLAGCVPPAPQPTPAPAPAPAQAETPPPAPPAPPPPPLIAQDWLDAPQSPGDWRYREGTASFGEDAGEPVLRLRCDRAARTIVMELVGAATPGYLDIRTETASRAVEFTVSASPTPTTVARFAALDPLLDAMAFSRGRFAIQAPGLTALYLPAYPEVTRVIEDCR